MKTMSPFFLVFANSSTHENIMRTVFEIRTIHLAGYFSGKAEEPLNQNKRSKINYGFGGHYNLCTLSGLCLFCNSNRMKSPFPDAFDEFLFVYASIISPKSLIISSPNKYQPCWSFKLAKY